MENMWTMNLFLRVRFQNIYNQQQFSFSAVLPAKDTTPKQF